MIGRFGVLLTLAGATLWAQGNAQPQAPRRNVERGRNFLGLAAPADPAGCCAGPESLRASLRVLPWAKRQGRRRSRILLRSAVVLHDDKGEVIGPFVKTGRPDKGMPAFPNMTPDQAYDIAEFLHKRVEDTANRFGYKLQNVVTGDAKAGEAYFDGHCKNCHSATGDLAHIGKTDPADLQALFLYPDRGDTAKVSATVTLPSGETVTGTVQRIDDFDVSILDSNGDYRSFPRSSVKLKLKDPLQGHHELLSQYSDADMHNILAYLVTLK